MQILLRSVGKSVCVCTLVDNWRLSCHDAGWMNSLRATGPHAAQMLSSWFSPRKQLCRSRNPLWVLA